MNGDFGQETYFPTAEHPQAFPLDRNLTVNRHALRIGEQYGWYLFTHKEPEKELTAFMSIDNCSRYANLFWYGQRYGGGCIIWGPIPSLTRVFRWGCEHKNHSERKIGAQFTKHTCEICTAVWEVDSSG